MKSELKNIFKRLEEFCAKPITDTVEFLMICLLLFVFRFILTGTMMYFNERNIFIYFSLLILSFALNCIANKFAELDGPYHWTTLIPRIMPYVLYAKGLYMVITK